MDKATATNLGNLNQDGLQLSTFRSQVQTGETANNFNPSQYKAVSPAPTFYYDANTGNLFAYSSVLTQAILTAFDSPSLPLSFDLYAGANIPFNIPTVLTPTSSDRISVVNVVPEPTSVTLSLLALGAGVAGIRRRGAQAEIDKGKGGRGSSPEGRGGEAA